MRIACPICGKRDRREFYYMGAAVALERPAQDAPAAEWHAYIHLRDNPCGMTRELWHHEAGCSAWLVVTRDTASHAVLAVDLASKVKGAAL